MNHNNEVVFRYPKEISGLQEKMVDEETKQYLVYGSIGKGGDSSKVNITALKKCYIILIHK